MDLNDLIGKDILIEIEEKNPLDNKEKYYLSKVVKVENKDKS
jgi:hypothetical protein